MFFIDMVGPMSSLEYSFELKVLTTKALEFLKPVSMSEQFYFFPIIPLTIIYNGFNPNYF